MPRRLRTSSGGLVYHVLNRGVGRRRLFDDEADYLAMERVIERTFKQISVRIVSYCLMPDHWHLALWPEQDGQLSEFMRLLTVTHTQRWHAHHHSAGTGPLYQGRFKSFPVEQDEHCLSVCRYVERNAVRANLVQSARDWQWCSLVRRRAGRPAWLLPMSRWPVETPHDWTAWVDRAESAAELEALQKSVNRGCPYGEPKWQSDMAEKLGLQSTLRPRGRQRVHPIKDSRPL